MSRNDLDEEELQGIANTCDVSIDRIQDVYACTPLQISTIAESTMRTGAGVFQFVLSLSERLDLDKFCVSFQKVIVQNSILRTRIVDSSHGLLQVVIDEEAGERNNFYLQEDGNVEEFASRDRSKALHLGSPLITSAIIGRKLILTMHHAIMDHTSMTPLLLDSLSFYHDKQTVENVPFKEFVSHCQNIDDAEAQEFWSSRFKGTPTIFPKIESGYLPNAEQKIIQNIHLPLVGKDIPMSHVPSYIETAWALTAGAYTGSESISYGLVLSGRTGLAGIEKTLGPTIAIVPVQANWLKTGTVGNMVKERASALRQLQTHNALQYGLIRIRNASDAAKAAAGFQTLLNIRPSHAKADESEDMTYDYMKEPTGAFALCLNCNLQEDGIEVEALSDSTVLEFHQFRRVINQFEHVLKTIMENNKGTEKIGQLQLLSLSDKEDILSRNEFLPKAENKCLHEMFGEQAQASPDSLAIDASDGKLTYSELDIITANLAIELKNSGISKGDRVAFLFGKSLWTVVAILAILRAGGTCVPLEMSDPIARQKEILSDSAIKTILSNESMDVTEGYTTCLIHEERRQELLKKEKGDNILPKVSPKDLAYIMFTSGSTGKPKGVLLEHCSLASSLSALAQKLGWNQDLRILQFAAHVWDIHIGEIFSAILFGGTLCIPSDEQRTSDIVGFINEKQVNWAWLTPTMIGTLQPSDVPCLKTLHSVGEAISAEHIHTWSKSLRFLNGWGPCESSILSAVCEFKPESRYMDSMGQPVGSAIWIVKPGKPDELAPIGAVGELLVEGPGVARGYLNDRVKTSASFISTPNWAPSREQPTKFYRTGDLGRYNPDGSISCLGRSDTQVKIRGQRFELGELESVLCQCDEVREVFTATKIASGRTELVAIICLQDDKVPRYGILEEITRENEGGELARERLVSVRDRIASSLPSFMMPTVWLVVQELPKASSAKLDRSAITEWLKKRSLAKSRGILDDETAASITPPETDVERSLQAIWSSILHVSEEKIGRESTFMALGGDSILAMQTASRLRKQGVSLSMQLLLSRRFSLSKIAGCCEPILDGENRSHSQDEVQNSSLSLDRRKEMIGRENPNLRAENIESIVPATDAQSLMIQVGKTRDQGYFVDFKIDLSPALDLSRLKEAYATVLKHHAILRAIFVKHDTILYQVVLKELNPSALTTLTDNTQESLLGKPDSGLLNIRLVSHDQKQCSQIHMSIHHALYDGVSIKLLHQDLNAAYTGIPLSEGPNFHDWISHVDTLDGLAPRKYWTDLLENSSSSRLAKRSEASIGRSLDATKITLVPLEAIQTTAGTPSCVLKAAWAMLLAAALGEDDLVFGEVSANRYLDMLDVDKVRGPCINFVPVRACLEQNITVENLISSLQDQEVESMPHHHLGFRSIIKDCTNWPADARFSSAVVYQNNGRVGIPDGIGGSTCRISGIGKLGDSADVWVTATPLESEELEVEFYFNPVSFNNARRNWFVDTFGTLLRELLEKPSAPVVDVNKRLPKYPV